MTTFDDKQLVTLANVLQREVAAIAPDWSGRDSSDPGVTLLELFAFIAEALGNRETRFDNREKAAVERLVGAARALESSRTNEADCGLRRPSYFSGQFLSVDDLTTEQAYFRSRLSRLNRALYGAGIVTGLDVSIERGGGKRAGDVHIDSGLAFDELGNEIAVCRPQSKPLPPKGKVLFVLVRYREQLCERVPAAGEQLGGTSETTTRPSRIVESFELSLAPTGDEPWVALARLRHSKGHWKLDRRFKARRVNR